MRDAITTYGKLPGWSLSPDATTLDYTVRLLASALLINEAIDALAGAPKFVTVSG